MSNVIQAIDVKYTYGPYDSTDTRTSDISNALWDCIAITSMSTSQMIAFRKVLTKIHDLEESVHAVNG